MRIERLKKNFDIEIQWRAFPLHPETPEQGLTLEELFAGRNKDIPAMQERHQTVAEEQGLPWRAREKSFNSRLAQELGKWAEAKGKGDAFHDAVFRAYFAEGKNIAKKPVLMELAKKAGLPKKAAEEALENGSFRDAVDADWSLSREWGVSAVPTFVIDRHAVVGAQPYEALEEFLRKNGVKEKKTSRPRTSKPRA